jgi:hypothetical protein
MLLSSISSPFLHPAPTPAPIGHLRQHYFSLTHARDDGAKTRRAPFGLSISFKLLSRTPSTN